MEKIEKGTNIEIKVPGVEKPIKAVVLDITGEYGGDNCTNYKYILYAQKRLFKASNSCHWGIDTLEDADGNIYGEEEYCNYTEFQYEGIIVDYCEIPSIPSDI